MSDNNLFILKNPIFKLLVEEIEEILKLISVKYVIEYNELKDVAFTNSNLAIKYGIKKRIKRKIDKDKQCMGRKIDREQCTRSRQTDSEFCKSHQKTLKYGRIDDVSFEEIPKRTRGRKRKNENSDYIATKVINIKNVRYLIDKDNIIYSYNIEHPSVLGVYDHENNVIKT
tara:strand:+ start:2591 stop:3103 length:513 start_codon:yes stop_codon:yes gene_type:complete